MLLSLDIKVVIINNDAIDYGTRCHSVKYNAVFSNYHYFK